MSQIPKALQTASPSNNSRAFETLQEIMHFVRSYSPKIAYLADALDRRLAMIDLPN